MRMANTLRLTPSNFASDNTCDAITSNIPQCCCGRLDCAFRLHSSKLIETVERDARTAGELGQVCGSSSRLLYGVRSVRRISAQPLGGLFATCH